MLIVVAALVVVGVSCQGSGPGPTEPSAARPDRPQSEEWLDPNASGNLDEPRPPQWQDHPELITEPGVVALVGDTRITRDEFFEELEKRHRSQALDVLIDDAIIALESERVGLELTEAEIRDYAEKMEKMRIESMTETINRDYRGRKTLEEYLRETRGIGVDEFKKQNIEKALKTGIAEKQRRIELLVAYEKIVSARVKISHIQVNTEEKALEIIRRLNAGGNFGKIAQEESEDPYSRTLGGALDAFHKGDEEFRRDLQGLGPKFLEAVFAAKIGLMEKPLKSGRDAWHVVMVLENQPARNKPLAEVRAEVEKEIGDGLDERDGFYWRQRMRRRYKIEEKKEGDVAVIVGPRKITVSELHARLNSLFGREAIQRMITARIVALESARIGLKNTDDEIRRMARRITDDRILQLRQLLTYEFPVQFGRTFTLEDYVRQEMGKPLADHIKDSTEELINSGQAKEELTLAKLVAHYLLTTERVTIQQAVFDSEYAARETWFKLRRGADFAKIARRHNPESLAMAEGVLPSFSREEYCHRPDLLAAGKNIIGVAFATGRGRFSGVFRCKDGWRIIKVLERQKARDLNYPALRERIRDEVFQGRQWMLYVPIWTRIKARSTNVAIKLPS